MSQVAIDVQEWMRMLTFFDYSCVRCFASGRMSRDHVVPRKYGAPDHISNVQPMCRSCNTQKGHGETIDYRPWAAKVLGRALPDEYRVMEPFHAVPFVGPRITNGNRT